jgi:Tfp pilus assembly protein PilF
MNAAADAEDKSEKATVTPGPIVPGRELLGDMLLERGDAKDALAAFEACLAKEANRLGSLLGAAKAAVRAGEVDKARTYYAKVVEMAGQADPLRTELAEARAFLANMR